MPLSDSIFIALNPDKNTVGKKMGQYKSVYTAFTLMAAIIAFFGFRYGLLSFNTKIKWVFIISAVAFAAAALLFYILLGRRKEKIVESVATYYRR